MGLWPCSYFLKIITRCNPEQLNTVLLNTYTTYNIFMYICTQFYRAQDIDMILILISAMIECGLAESGNITRIYHRNAGYKVFFPRV